MFTYLRPTGNVRLRLVSLLWLALLLFVCQSAFASHYRYGSISWQPVASDPSGKTIQFKVSVAYRTSYGYNNPVVLGGTIREVSFNFGDGTSVTPDFVVTSINSSEDWFFGEVTLTHTYANAGNVTAYYSSCCRIGQLQNNANENYRMNTLVNVGTPNRSPVATTIPILNIPTGQAAATAIVPASDPDGDALTYSLATSAELGVTLSQPSGLSINPTTGQLTFNTVGKSNNNLYSTVIKISDGKTAIFVDLIIRISGAATNPPTFVYTNNATPANGSTITAMAGMPVSFSVTAVDSDPDALTLNAAGLPSGSTTTPTLQTTGNPVSTVFSWTPTSTGTSVLVFTATDPTGNQVSTSVTIQVTAQMANRPPVYNGLLTNQNATAGAPFSYAMPSGTFTDPDGDALTYSATGLPSGLSLSGTTISGTPSSASGSPFVVTITATDPGMLSATGSFTLVISPVTTSCGSPTATIGQPLQLLAPTYDCNGNGDITFNVVGGDGSAVEFQCIPGISVNGQGGWNTNCVQKVDAEIRTAPDAPIMALQARQNGTVVYYYWNLRAQCPVSRPPASTTANQSPGLINPIPNITATQNTPFNYTIPANTFADPDGDPITLTAAGLPTGLHFMNGMISGTPVAPGAYPVTVTAGDGSGLTSSSTFILTVTAAPGGGGGTPNTAFAIAGVTGVSCQITGANERQLTFTPQYSGTNGQSITFQIVNETMPVTSASAQPVTVRLYMDNPVINLKANQSGVDATFAYSWQSACSGSMRAGVRAEMPLAISVQGNPVAGESAQVEITGITGTELQLQLVDSRGHVITDRTISHPASVEKASVRLGQASGIYLLRVATADQQQTVRIAKQ